jgi:hypothetical protein
MADDTSTGSTAPSSGGPRRRSTAAAAPATGRAARTSKAAGANAVGRQSTPSTAAANVASTTAGTTTPPKPSTATRKAAAAARTPTPSTKTEVVVVPAAFDAHEGPMTPAVALTRHIEWLDYALVAAGAEESWRRGRLEKATKKNRLKREARLAEVVAEIDELAALLVGLRALQGQASPRKRGRARSSTTRTRGAGSTTRGRRGRTTTTGAG